MPPAHHLRSRSVARLVPYKRTAAARAAERTVAASVLVFGSGGGLRRSRVPVSTFARPAGGVVCTLTRGTTTWERPAPTPVDASALLAACEAAVPLFVDALGPLPALYTTFDCGACVVPAPAFVWEDFESLFETLHETQSDTGSETEGETQDLTSPLPSAVSPKSQ